MTLPIATLTRSAGGLVAGPVLPCDLCGEDADMCREYGCPHSDALDWPAPKRLRCRKESR